MAAKKKTAKKKAAAKAATKATTKSETLSYIADKTGLTKKDVGAVFDALSMLIKRDLKRTGPGFYNVPGLMKIKVVRKPATKARKGINPFTGEEMVFKAKPARNVVKVTPLKNLKDMV
ncbi:HU family DNA-binding protein [Thiohalobacter thiocyanaticus]|uniref:Viral histone-like protein n=1 Tax=Thiohalobacter thiocyanaticus TaxID=585455 RepID=A0A426QKH5_9GAMM|nr:HU family DNA-binding protein [Thiohalobacter thiocyanaticus]RRQ22261.1 DNA-binding protein [Thiohalobacter thiocyanaticus]